VNYHLCLSCLNLLKSESAPLLCLGKKSWCLLLLSSSSHPAIHGLNTSSLALLRLQWEHFKYKPQKQPFSEFHSKYSSLARLEC
jgi:hypothetical protein